MILSVYPTMFIGHEEAGGPAAVLMSLLQTCVEQGVNAVAYLRDVLERIVTVPGSPRRRDRDSGATSRVRSRGRRGVVHVRDELTQAASPARGRRHDVSGAGRAPTTAPPR